VSAILSSEVYCLRDAVRDPRLMTNPLVACSLGLRFYAAAPLRTRDGFSLGTLSVIDRKPRDMASSEAEMLTKMAALVMDQKGLRLSARQVAVLSKQLRQANEQVAQSEERFRGLFDEAPIAYVRQDTDTHILRANRTAMKILDVKPEEIGGPLHVAGTGPPTQSKARPARGHS